MTIRESLDELLESGELDEAFPTLEDMVKHLEKTGMERARDIDTILESALYVQTVRDATPDQVKRAKKAAEDVISWLERVIKGYHKQARRK